MGDGPLIIAAPHVGTHIPPAIAAKMNDDGRAVRETDFHVHRLFDFTRELGATTLFATHSRYVVDLNRDPEGANLYPGRFETGLCPVSDFDQRPIYPTGHEPCVAEIVDRREQWWQPYHDALHQALNRAVARHGKALLIDAHSIRPQIPSLFEGRLPDLNFGTNSGMTLGPKLTGVLNAWRNGQSAWSHVLDGRFKGGYTTRHYGQPENGVQALQIEIVQDCYLNSATPHLYDAAKAAPLSQALKPLVEQLLAAL
ncbi:MAG: N-formylglutamate deformylase [Asticcacaulis sp.]|nr:N-formylglutamate deformylase [Asticcacaulis sp.]